MIPSNPGVRNSDPWFQFTPKYVIRSFPRDAFKSRGPKFGPLLLNESAYYCNLGVRNSDFRVRIKDTTKVILSNPGVRNSDPWFQFTPKFVIRSFPSDAFKSKGPKFGPLPLNESAKTPFQEFAIFKSMGLKMGPSILNNGIKIAAFNFKAQGLQQYNEMGYIIASPKTFIKVLQWVVRVFDIHTYIHPFFGKAG